MYDDFTAKLVTENAALTAQLNALRAALKASYEFSSEKLHELHDSIEHHLGHSNSTCLCCGIEAALNQQEERI